MDDEPMIPTTMRTAVLVEPRLVELEERAVPQPAAGEVLVRVLSVGVCGSDTHYFEHGRIGRYVVRAPLVLGHEPSGVVVATGDGVDPGRVGQRVSLEPGIPCRSCRQCLAGRYNLCPRMRFMATPPVDGAFAEYVTTLDAFAHRVPDELSDHAAALLEPLSVAVWAAGKADVRHGTRVLVTGAGPVGLLAAQVCRALGATEVVVSDVNPHRLSVARALGATATVDVASSSLADGGVQADALLECSGSPAATTDGIRALDRAGRAVLIGMGADEVPVPLGHVQDREITIAGVFRYANTWPTAISLASRGEVDLDRLVSAVFPLRDAATALTAGVDDPTCLKAVVRPGAE